jgi:thiosulfate dehydrogenase [quinone] large subunit
MKATSSIIIVAIATLLGLFFGNALGGVGWALILGAISAAGASFSVWRYESAEAAKTPVSEVEDPPFARFLFKDTRAAALWLPLRLFIGWEWLDAGWHKFQDPKWMDTGESILGYWQRAVTVPEPPARAAITYDWWRDFLQMLINTESHVWFGKLITIGEILVGLGLIAGALVGIAAFSGMLMNLSFLLSGSTSTNPLMLTIAFLLVLAWKTAGWIGVDRILLPALGTPWQAGALVRRTTPATAATP